VAAAGIALLIAVGVRTLLHLPFQPSIEFIADRSLRTHPAPAERSGSIAPPDSTRESTASVATAEHAGAELANALDAIEAWRQRDRVFVEVLESDVATGATQPLPAAEVSICVESGGQEQVAATVKTLPDGSVERDVTAVAGLVRPAGCASRCERRTAPSPMVSPRESFNG
jgi:hypothetical protein